MTSALYSQDRPRSTGYAKIYNFVLQTTPMRYAKAVQIWQYLRSKPHNWIPIKRQLCKHFGIAMVTLNRQLAFLNETNLISYEQKRNKNGTFSQGKIIVHDGLNYDLEAYEKNRKSRGRVTIDGKEIEKNAHACSLSSPPAKPHSARPKKTPKTRAPSSQNPASPKYHFTEVRLNESHNKERKKKERKNKNHTSCSAGRPVSSFSLSSSQEVGEFITTEAASREVVLTPELTEEGIFHAYDGNADKSRGEVIRKSRGFLKMVQAGVWKTPYNFEKFQDMKREQRKRMEQKAAIEAAAARGELIRIRRDDEYVPPPMPTDAQRANGIKNLGSILSDLRLKTLSDFKKS